MCNFAISGSFICLQTIMLHRNTITYIILHLLRKSTFCTLLGLGCRIFTILMKDSSREKGSDWIKNEHELNLLHISILEFFLGKHSLLGYFIVLF